MQLRIRLDLSAVVHSLALARIWAALMFILKPFIQINILKATSFWNRSGFPRLTELEALGHHFSLQGLKSKQSNKWQSVPKWHKRWVSLPNKSLFWSNILCQLCLFCLIEAPWLDWITFNLCDISQLNVLGAAETQTSHPDIYFLFWQTLLLKNLRKLFLHLPWCALWMWVD